MHHHRGIDNSDAQTFFAKPTRRPASLALKNKEKPHYISTDDNLGPWGIKIKQEKQDSDEEVASTSRSSWSPDMSLNARRLSLEETVNMLRQSSAHKARDRDQHNNKHSVSPSQSESRSSRRSSRSSTPNVTPIKTDLLTPCSTPCSSPDKSPCASPTTSSGRFLGKKKKSQVKYLFAKNDEVLARWHDGRFYLGKILKVWSMLIYVALLWEKS